MTAAYAISTIVGDDAWTLDRLKTQRIHTSTRLLEQAKRPKARKALSQKTGNTETEILDMANVADLMRVKGIGRAYVNLLRAAGVNTVRDLRSRNAKNLYLAMALMNVERKIVEFIPWERMVIRWVEQAKQLQLLITY